MEEIDNRDGIQGCCCSKLMDTKIKEVLFFRIV
jgi:hypothetical protein